MSLSAREQRILSEIERDLTASESLLGRALAGMRVGLRSRIAASKATYRPRGRNASPGWVIAMITALIIGIGLMSAGLVLGSAAMAIGGAALTQLSLVTGWLVRALRTGQRGPAD